MGRRTRGPGDLSAEHEVAIAAVEPLEVAADELIPISDIDIPEQYITDVTVEADGTRIVSYAPRETSDAIVEGGIALDDIRQITTAPDGTIIAASTSLPGPLQGTEEPPAEPTAADLLAENTREITESPEQRQERLAEEYAAALAAAQQAEAQALERGETGFDMGMLTTAMQIFGGQEGEAQQGFGGFINQYYEAGQGIEYQITEGGFGIGTMLNLMEGQNGDPVQIPRQVFDSAREMAITQIVNNPDMLANFETGDPERDAQLQAIGALIADIESPQERQEFAQNLILIVEGQTDVLRMNGQHQELPPEMILLMQQQVNDIVGQTLAGGVSELGGQLEGTGILGFIREALGGILEFAQDMINTIAPNANLNISSMFS